MPTQIQSAQQKIITPEMEIVAKKEQMDSEKLMQLVAEGKIVIPANKEHLKKKLIPMGIGKFLATKVNANIGASPYDHEIEHEVEKLKNAEKYGADTIMDLSTAGDLDLCRQAIIDNSTIPVGTVPIYEIVEKYGILGFTPKNCLEIIEKQAKQGVDYFTIHAGFKRDFIPLVTNGKRLTGVVSRGGGILQKWMEYHKQENPLLQVFDEISEIMKQYDITYSLGDTLRPGSLHDCNDEAQISELKFLGELTKRAWKSGVQVMVEGPGHVPIHMIKEQMELEKKYCHDAPFYVLGPLTIDSGAGYDHITGAIGGAVAAQYGADMLCYVTPAEHLGLPDKDDVKDGIIAFKIAARSGDIAKNVPGAWERENQMSKYRKSFNWGKMHEMSMDKEKFAHYRFDSGYEGQACGMCGEKMCPMKTVDDLEEETLFKDREKAKGAVIPELIGNPVNKKS